MKKFKTFLFVTTILLLLPGRGTSCVFNIAGNVASSTIVKQHINVPVLKSTAKTRRFTTGSFICKPYLCIDREAGYVYTSWSTLLDDNDHLVKIRKARYFKKGIPGKRVVISSLVHLLNEFNTNQAILRMRLLDGRSMLVFKSDTDVWYNIQSRFCSADPVLNI